jgi:hypothetical protein
MSLPKIPFGNWNAAINAEAKFYALGGTFRVRANQVFSMFNFVGNYEVRSLRKPAIKNQQLFV